MTINAVDKEICLNNNLYWRFVINNVECIPYCDKNIILFSENEGQYVDDCKNYINPYLISTIFFILFNCS